jgi:hypothetical protein
MNSLPKQFAVAAAASVLLATSAFALSTSEVEGLTQKIAGSKVVEAPALAAKLVVQSSKEDLTQVARTVVTAVARNHQTALGNTVTAIIRKAPQATEAVVEAACEAAPQQASAIVAAAVLADDSIAQLASSVAVRVVPSMVASSTTATREISAPLAVPGAGATVTQTPIVPSTPPVAVTGYVGRDPNRP